MASFNKTNRLNPPLMWAFRSAAERRDSREKPKVGEDRDGERLVSGRKGSSSASVTETILRREVWRHLEQMMNTIALESTLHDVAKAPHVRTSILNFGLPDMAHRTIDELNGNGRALERQMESALQTFEPRLIDGSVKVKRDMTVDPAALKVRFLVNADLACRPVDIPLEFTADVEIVSGKFTISRL